MLLLRNYAVDVLTRRDLYKFYFLKNKDIRFTLLQCSVIKCKRMLFFTSISKKLDKLKQKLLINSKINDIIF